MSAFAQQSADSTKTRHSGVLGLCWRSWLPESAKPALQEMFFFNPRQGLYCEEIVAAVSQFGEPQIFQAGEGLTLGLPRFPEAQCLFAVEQSSSNPCAGILFTRHGNAELEILHLAISASWQASGDLRSTTLTVVAKMKQIARSIRGIDLLRLPYGRGCLRVGN
jgi:hypothetical protein